MDDSTHSVHETRTGQLLPAGAGRGQSRSKTIPRELIDQLISSIHTELYGWKFFRHGLEDLSDGEARRFDRDLARALRKALEQRNPTP